MHRFAVFLALLHGCGALSGCALPRNQTEVMHGQVIGGKVPLYKTGSLPEFFRAGLVLPDTGGYARTEFDVFNIGRDGGFTSASGGGAASTGTVAQMALPRRVSSFDLSRSDCEMRAAVPAAGEGGAAVPVIAAAPATVPRSGAAAAARPKALASGRSAAPAVAAAEEKAPRAVSLPPAVATPPPGSESSVAAVTPPSAVSNSPSTGMEGLWAATPASRVRHESTMESPVTKMTWGVEHFLNVSHVP